MKKRILALLAAGTLLLTGCGAQVWMWISSLRQA